MTLSGEVVVVVRAAHPRQSGQSVLRDDRGWGDGLGHHTGTGGSATSSWSSSARVWTLLGSTDF